MMGNRMLKWVGGGLVLAILAAITVTGITNGSGGGWPTFFVVLIGASVIGFVRNRVESAKDQQATLVWARKKEADRARELNAAKQAAKVAEQLKFRQDVEQRFKMSLAVGMSTYSTLPWILRRANEATKEAESYFDDGAFSPFWEAVERAYVALGDYSESLHTLALGAMEYAELVNGYSSVEPPGTYPVTVEAAQATAVVTGLVDELQALVYRAQKEPVFALIWEQRRTTSAVIAGFSNLQEAVARMTVVVAGRVYALEVACREEADSTRRAIREEGRSVAVATASVHQAVVELQGIVQRG